jgi:hypothetical protein
MGYFSSNKEYRYFKVVSVNNKKITTDGRYKTKTSPQSAAKKAFTQLSKKYKTNKLTICIKETTQSSLKKEYGPYLVQKIRLKKPLEVVFNGNPAIIKYQTKIRSLKKKQKGGGKGEGSAATVAANSALAAARSALAANNALNNTLNKHSHNMNSKVYAIYGQSLDAKNSKGNNKTLSEALLNWISMKGSLHNYVILCGPSDEKSEMKHYLSVNSTTVLNLTGIENVHTKWCGYPFCIYNLVLQDGKQLHLVELCETVDFRSTTTNNRRPGKGSGGSLNTFENLLELFTCFAYLRTNETMLKDYQVANIFHCAGSGKAQVARAMHNMIAVPFTEEIGKQQMTFWDKLMEDADISDFELNKNQGGQILSRFRTNNISYEDYKTVFRANFTKISDVMEGQCQNAITTGKNKVLKKIYGYNNSQLQIVEQQRLRLSEMIKSIQNGNIEYTSQFFDLLYPRTSNMNIMPVGDSSYTRITPRPEIRVVVDEFMAWGMIWTTWPNEQFISYLYHPGTPEAPDLGKALFKDRLKIDVWTACTFLAGWNRGDIAQAIIGFYYGPRPESFPQSVRHY